MLSPETRVLLGDALRPPAGLQLDVAVGTTYSLDLTAVLLAPLSFALVEPSEDVTAIDPTALLAAVRRYADRTTVFCQAGAIAVPAAYRNALTFIEDSVHEVLAPASGRLFHPKVWVLRFGDGVGADRHRVVVLSRNMTFDRSWDTVLVLDEDEDEDGGAPLLDPAPVTQFVRALPRLAVRPVPDARLLQIESMAVSLEGARLSVPAPFDAGAFHPLGLGSTTWPLPANGDRALVISPFLDVRSVRDLAGSARRRTLVSRPETFDRLGSDAVHGWEVRTFSRFAEGAEDPAVSDEEQPTTSHPDKPASTTPPEGLHAKVVVVDAGARAHLLTGSPNATTRAWDGNVEMVVVLEGPARSCGVGAILGEDGDGLARLLEPYTPAAEGGVAEPRAAVERDIDEFHRALAAGAARMEVEDLTEDTASLVVRLELPGEPVGRSEMWPITLRRDVAARPLSDRARWSDVTWLRITPFVAVETTAGSGEARVTRRCVVRAELVGDPAGRRAAVVRAALPTTQDAMRYLALLLADPRLGHAHPSGDFRELGGTAAGTGRSTGHAAVIFEPLVRAVARGRADLDRVAGMIDELRGQTGLFPPEFDELWDAVREVAAQEADR